MKILHVVPSYLPANRYGGTIYSVHGLCSALAGLGHDVHVFTTSVDGPDDSPVPLGIPVDIDGVKVWYFRSPFFRRLYWAPGMRTALDGRVSSFDIVHIHSIFLWPTAAAARTAFRRGVPYVLSPRGMLEKGLVQRRSRRVKKAWITLVERWNCEHAALMHYTSEREQSEAARYGFFLRREVVVPNGVVPVEEGERGLAFKSEKVTVVISDPTPYFLFLSRISWKKGLDRLLDGLALAPSLRLVIAGNDDEQYWPTIAARIVELGMSARVRYVGNVHGPDKTALYRGALALVLPSYSENFGNVVLEAMSAGCPVVVTPEVGAAAIVRRFEAGLVVEGNPVSLARALTRLATETDLRDAMGQRGKMAAAEYSWKNVAQSMAAEYGDAIAAAS